MAWAPSGIPYVSPYRGIMPLRLPGRPAPSIRPPAAAKATASGIQQAVQTAQQEAGPPPLAKTAALSTLGGPAKPKSRLGTSKLPKKPSRASLLPPKLAGDIWSQLARDAFKAAMAAPPMAPPTMPQMTMPQQLPAAQSFPVGGMAQTPPAPQMPGAGQPGEMPNAQASISGNGGPDVGGSMGGAHDMQLDLGAKAAFTVPWITNLVSKLGKPALGALGSAAKAAPGAALNSAKGLGSAAAKMIPQTRAELGQAAGAAGKGAWNWLGKPGLGMAGGSQSLGYLGEQAGHGVNALTGGTGWEQTGRQAGETAGGLAGGALGAPGGTSLRGLGRNLTYAGALEGAGHLIGKGQAAIGIGPEGIARKADEYVARNPVGAAPSAPAPTPAPTPTPAPSPSAVKPPAGFEAAARGAGQAYGAASNAVGKGDVAGAVRGAAGAAVNKLKDVGGAIKPPEWHEHLSNMIDQYLPGFAALPTWHKIALGVSLLSALGGGITGNHTLGIGGALAGGGLLMPLLMKQFKASQGQGH